jgi:hypothetical protein
MEAPPLPLTRQQQQSLISGYPSTPALLARTSGASSGHDTSSAAAKDRGLSAPPILLSRTAGLGVLSSASLRKDAVQERVYDGPRPPRRSELVSSSTRPLMPATTKPTHSTSDTSLDASVKSASDLLPADLCKPEAAGGSWSGTHSSSAQPLNRTSISSKPEAAGGSWSGTHSSAQPLNRTSFSSLSEDPIVGSGGSGGPFHGPPMALGLVSGAKPQWADVIERKHEEYISLFTSLPSSFLSERWQDGDTQWSPLALAIERGDNKTVLWLLGHGAQPNRSFSMFSSLWTPLGLALKVKKLDLVQALLDCKADPSQVFAGAWTALGYAVAECHDAAVRLLLACGADANETFGALSGGASRWTALGYSILVDSPSIALLLLEAGADAKQLFMMDWLSRSPLDYALEKKRDNSFVAMLIIRGGASSAKVESLDLSNQSLDALPLSLLQCRALRTLKACGVCVCVCVCVWFERLMFVRVKLAGNPLGTLPPNIRTASWPAIREYMQEVESSGGKMPWTKSKVRCFSRVFLAFLLTCLSFACSLLAYCCALPSKKRSWCWGKRDQARHTS